MLKSSRLKILCGNTVLSEGFRMLWDALSETDEVDIPVHIRTGGGSIVTCNILVVPVRDELGNLPVYVLFFQKQNECARGSSVKRPSRSRLQLKTFHSKQSESIKAGQQFMSVDPIISIRDETGNHSDVPNASGDDQRRQQKNYNHWPCFGWPCSRRKEDGSTNYTDSLLLPSSANDTTGVNSTQNVMSAFQPYNGTVETRPKGRKSPPNWCLLGANNLDNVVHTVRLRPPESRGRTGIDDLEALRLILSTNPETNKSSVTERFAQFLSMDEDLHVEHRLQPPHIHRFTLRHYSMFKAVWDWIVLALIIYTAIVTPLVALPTAPTKNLPSNETNTSRNSPRYQIFNGNTLYLDYFVDIMFIIDIVINFRTTYVNKNDEVVSHPKRIAIHYIKGWFIIDLIAAVPFDHIFREHQDLPPTMTGLLKCARLLRLARVVRKLDRYSDYGATILLLFTASFALFAHWMACVWYAIGHYEHQRDGPKIGWFATLTEQLYKFPPSLGASPSEPTVVDKYVTALYFTVSSLTSVGFGNVSPNSDLEKIFSIVVMLTGSLMYANIFGYMSALIQRLYNSAARYHAQMLRIKEFIRFHQIPSPLCQRLIEYSSQVWEHTNGIDMTMVLYSFPESLQSDICLYVFRDFLRSSAAFRSLSDGCLRSISLRIRSTHMPSSDTLIHTGDLLNGVYYVAKGYLEVVTTDDAILAVLNPGDFFGVLPLMVVMDSNKWQSNLSLHKGTLVDGASSCIPWKFSTPKATHLGPQAFVPNTANSRQRQNLDSSYLLQPNLPLKSRFVVRAVTDADVQCIDRHDFADLCSVYTQLPGRMMKHFELTIPLVSTTIVAATGAINVDNNSHFRYIQPPAYSRSAPMSSVDAFLETASSWNPVSPTLLASVYPLTSQHISRKHVKGYEPLSPSIGVLSPDQPIPQLERLQRLFCHGCLCFGSIDHQNILANSITVPTTQTSAIYSIHGSEERLVEMASSNPSLSQSLISEAVLGDHPLQPAPPVLNPVVHITPDVDLRESHRIVNQLYDRLSRLEQRLTNFDVRVSDTISDILHALDCNASNGQQTAQNTTVSYMDPAQRHDQTQ